MKQCPQCRHKALKITRYQDQEIDVCPSCRGLWFEAGEFDAALGNDEKEPVIEGKHRKAHESTDMSCPDCDATLDRHHLLKGYEVEIERCPAGHGIWIEREELDEALAAEHLHEPLERLNDKTSWRTWLFQFVTQMPVEYNIRPRQRPWVTWSLILVNTLIFVASMMDLRFAELSMQGAMIPEQISTGNHLTTLLTSQFLHGGWMHLIGNMYFLWIIGDNLEDALGHRRFLLAYLGCGTVAALAQTLIEPSSTIPVIGASGAIAGLFGLYLLWFRKASLTFMIFVYQKKVAPWVFFLIWLGINVFGMATGAQGVAYMAHIGGFVCGLVLGYLLLNWVRQNYPLLQLLNSDKVVVQR